MNNILTKLASSLGFAHSSNMSLDISPKPFDFHYKPTPTAYHFKRSSGPKGCFGKVNQNSKLGRKMSRLALHV